MKYSVDNLIVYDLEVNPNYFLAGFMFPDGTLHQFGFTDTDTSNLQALQQFINWVEQSEYTLAGFNSVGYDDPVLSEFLLSPSTATAYRVSVAIIEQGVKYWEFTRDIFSIDLMQILPNRISLKKIGVCLGHKKLQELPVNPHANLTVEEMQVVATYNHNDLIITQKLAAAVYKELVLRSDLSNEYNIDVRSKGEAAIAEMILCTEMERATGLKKTLLKNRARENVSLHPSFSIKIPSWWSGLDFHRYPLCTIDHQ